MSRKSIADHGLDLITGNNCNLLQSIFRADHVICEPRALAVPTHDVTYPSDAGPSPEEAHASSAVAPSDGVAGAFGPDRDTDPGGLSGSETY